MPLVLLEAMAMGLPIVATNVTGSRDVVKDGQNGLLIPYDDTFSFRLTLLKIKNSDNLYEKMSNSSRKMSMNYSWEKIATQFNKFYESVI